MSQRPTATIAIPTRHRAGYLDVTLASIVPQSEREGAEVLVLRDGDDPATEAVAGRYRVRLVSVPSPGGLNAGRNLALREAASDLIVFVDDDVRADPGWLRALLDGVQRAPDHDVFGGPIRAVLEGGGPRACGREKAPITTLDLGPADLDTMRVWGANMAIRRHAIALAGPFDESLAGRGDEEEWQERLRAANGRIRYVAAASLEHRRTRRDATLRALSRTDYALGRTARRNDVRKGTAPGLATELRTLAGCLWHVIRRRCAVGLVMAAHTAGRIRGALAERGWTATRDGVPPPAGRHTAANPAPSDDFMSGTSGEVSGIRATTRAVAADLVCDAVAWATLRPPRLRRAARAAPRRRILVLAVERRDRPNVLAAARGELLRSRHDVNFVSAEVGDQGKFENLNRLLAQVPASGHDWLLVIDDDVALPAGFLDVFVFLVERFGLSLAQPAHRHRSHAAWQVTRRWASSVVRETAFVETGPVTAFGARTFDVLLPFPELRAGWGLDHHWSAVAREHGWRLGVVDATPIGHALRRVAASYGHRAAIEEARAFLRDKPYTTASEAQRTLAVHRSWH